MSYGHCKPSFCHSVKDLVIRASSRIVVEKLVGSRVEKENYSNPVIGGSTVESRNSKSGKWGGRRIRTGIF